MFEGQEQLGNVPGQPVIDGGMCGVSAQGAAAKALKFPAFS